jgi:hypothetical protein
MHAEVSGYVRKINVDIGDRVKTGRCWLCKARNSWRNCRRRGRVVMHAERSPTRRTEYEPKPVPRGTRIPQFPRLGSRTKDIRLAN